MLYIVRCQFELLSPLHCGTGEDDGIYDAPVIRDAYGYWKIPGTALAGAMRSWFRKHRGEERSKTLFGYEETDGTSDDGSASPFWISDAVLLDFDNTPVCEKFFAEKQEGQEKPEIPSVTCIRDHVLLNLETGATDRGGKFDEEYVPAGARFFCEFTLNGCYQKLTDELVSDFSFVLAGFAQGAISLAGSAAIGFGMVAVRSLSGRYFDFTTSADVEAWLNLDRGTCFADANWTPAPISEEELQPKGSGISGWVSIPCVLETPLLVAGAGSATVDADLTFATTVVCDYKAKTLRDAYILPGSSIRGCIRHRIARISTDLGLPKDTLDALFGFVEGTKAKRGKLRFLDAELRVDGNPVSDEHCRRIQHVSIDRITGGALDAHLFNEAPVWGKNTSFTLTIYLEDIHPREAGLLLHALLDIAQGDLSFGGGETRGNGVVRLRSPKALRCNLVWDGRTLTETMPEEAENWLLAIDDALRENQ